MPPRTHILEDGENLRRPLVGSVLLHVCLASLLVTGTWVTKRTQRVPWGDIGGGGMGSVAVNAVSRIPLPSRGGALNPVARDTESLAPEPPASKTRAEARAREPETDAIPLPSRNAKKRPAEASSGPNKFREQQQYAPNQVYSQSGQSMSSPMIGMSGGGGIGIGNDSPFGRQFGWYATAVKNMVSKNWKTSDLNLRTAEPVYVTFVIRRDGSVPYDSVKVTRSSRVPALDMSAQRAILASQPFPKLPPEYPGNDVEIEFQFFLRR